MRLSCSSGTAGHSHLFVKLLQQRQNLVVLPLDLEHPTRERTQAPVCQADAVRLPLASGICDRVFCAYVLDLLPEREIATVLAGLYRILRPGGRIALVSLTDGTTLASRGVIAVWKVIHAVNPLILGGCSPLRLAGLVRTAGFIDVESETVVQLGIPSEIVAARR